MRDVFPGRVDRNSPKSFIKDCTDDADKQISPIPDIRVIPGFVCEIRLDTEQWLQVHSADFFSFLCLSNWTAPLTPR